jgi:hypothetical protein
VALAILYARHDTTGNPKAGLVFPAPESSRPVDTFSDMKDELAEAAHACRVAVRSLLTSRRDDGPRVPIDMSRYSAQRSP